MTDQRIGLDALVEDPKNARVHGERNRKMIAASLKSHGAARSIVLDENNQIIAGHGVVAGARDVGITTVRVVESDGDEIIAVRRAGLTQAQKIDLALADNRAQELSEWDPDMLEAISRSQDIGHLFTMDEMLALSAIDPVIPEPEQHEPRSRQEHPRQITFSSDQWTIIRGAIEQARNAGEFPPGTPDGRFIELICADWLSGQ